MIGGDLADRGQRLRQLGNRGPQVVEVVEFAEPYSDGFGEAGDAAALAGQEGARTSERWERAQAPGGVVRDAPAPQLEAHDPAPS